MKKAALIIIFLIALYPVFIMVYGSFQNIHGSMSMPPILNIRTLTLSNYKFLVIDNKDFLRWIYNSFFVVVFTVIISVSVCILAGYSFSFHKSRYNKYLFAVLMIPILLPRISLLIPQYVLLSRLHLSDSLWGVILPCSYYPAGIYIARNFFNSFPRSIIESAKIDGANSWTVISKIIIPLSKPLVSCLTLFVSVGALQDFIWQMLVLQKDENQTLLVGIMRLAMKRGGGITFAMHPVSKLLTAGTILFALLFFIFIVSNKYFISTLEGALKE